MFSDYLPQEQDPQPMVEQPSQSNPLPPAAANGDVTTLVGQYRTQDGQGLSEAVSAASYPLGAYAKPHPSQNFAGEAYSSREPFSSDQDSSGSVIGGNSMGLGVSPFKNFSGVGSGGIFTPFPTEQDPMPSQDPSNIRWDSIDQEPQPEKLWSRVVGVKQGAEQLVSKDTPPYQKRRPELQFTGGGESLHDNSFGYEGEEEDEMKKFFPLRPSEDFVHQSQVDHDAFQPYAGAKDTPLLIPLGGGGGGKEGEIPKVPSVVQQGHGWSKEEEEDVLMRGRSVGGGKKSRGRGGRGDVAGMEETGGDSNGLSGLGNGDLLSWSSPSRVERNAKAKDAFLSSSTSSSTAPTSATAHHYGLDLGMHSHASDMSSTWGGNSIMASALAAATTVEALPTSGGSGRLEVELGRDEEDPFPARYKPRPLSGLEETVDSDGLSDPDMFGEYGGGVATGGNAGAEMGDTKFSCLLCYRVFKNAEELGSHCGTSSHLERALWDSGAEEVWQYAPPPPGRVNRSRLRVCTK